MDILLRVPNCCFLGCGTFFIEDKAVHVYWFLRSRPNLAANYTGFCDRDRTRGHQSNENLKRFACFCSVLREGLITTKRTIKQKDGKQVLLARRSLIQIRCGYSILIPGKIYRGLTTQQ